MLICPIFIVLNNYITWMCVVFMLRIRRELAGEEHRQGQESPAAFLSQRWVRHGILNSR